MGSEADCSPELTIGSASQDIPPDPSLLIVTNPHKPLIAAQSRPSMDMLETFLRLSVCILIDTSYAYCLTHIQGPDTA
jgi:hypothetical protein